MMRPSATTWTLPFCPPPGHALDWRAVEDPFPSLEALALCPQDPEYHAEGDVLTHTRMVCDALITLPQWQELPDQDRSVLLAAAIFHDVAKPLCTVTGPDGRISSKGHALKGAHILRALLYRGATPASSPPLAVREAICALVRYHGLPLSFFDKPDPPRALIHTSLTTRLDHLALLAEADILGRRCATQRDLLDRVSLFREFAREHHCYTTPYSFASDHARLIYFERESSPPDYAAYDDTRGHAVLLSGLPGSGKDHYAATHLPDTPVISLDALRQEMSVDPADEQGAVVHRAKDLARGHLRAGAPFVWNATNTTRLLRGQVLRLFRSYNARTSIVYVEAPYATLLDRNRRRPSPVPAAVIDRLIDRLDVPDLSEAHTVTHHQ